MLCGGVAFFCLGGLVPGEQADLCKALRISCFCVLMHCRDPVPVDRCIAGTPFLWTEDGGELQVPVLFKGFTCIPLALPGPRLRKQNMRHCLFVCYLFVSMEALVLLSLSQCAQGVIRFGCCISYCVQHLFRLFHCSWEETVCWIN